MINLIPPAAKKTYKRQYLQRVATVWAWLVVGAVLVGIAFAAPVFLLIDLQQRAVESEQQQRETMQESYETAKKEITAANTLATYLHKNELTTSSSLFNYKGLLDELTISGIRLNEYVFTRTDTGVGIAVSGTAATRSGLSEFVNGIEDSEYFTEAELPIGNLAKERDISFSLTITPATE